MPILRVVAITATLVVATIAGPVNTNDRQSTRCGAALPKKHCAVCHQSDDQGRSLGTCELRPVILLTSRRGFDDRHLPLRPPPPLF